MNKSVRNYKIFKLPRPVPIFPGRERWPEKSPGIRLERRADSRGKTALKNLFFFNEGAVFSGNAASFFAGGDARKINRFCPKPCSFLGGKAKASAASGEEKKVKAL